MQSKAATETLQAFYSKRLRHHRLLLHTMANNEFAVKSFSSMQLPLLKCGVTWFVTRVGARRLDRTANKHKQPKNEHELEFNEPHFTFGAPIINRIWSGSGDTRIPEQACRSCGSRCSHQSRKPLSRKGPPQRALLRRVDKHGAMHVDAVRKKAVMSTVDHSQPLQSLRGAFLLLKIGGSGSRN